MNQAFAGSAVEKLDGRNRVLATRSSMTLLEGGAKCRALSAVSRRIGNWWIGAFVRYDSLRGAVFDDSPLVRRDHELRGGVGVSWVFATSDRQVAVDD